MTGDEPLPADDDEARFDDEGSAVGKPAALETPEQERAAGAAGQPRAGLVARLLGAMRPRRPG
jgi:hypothetical protein